MGLFRISRELQLGIFSWRAMCKYLHTKGIRKLLSGVMVRAAFSHSVSGRMFPGYTVSFWRKSTQIRKLLRSYSSKNESLEGEFLGIFYLKICFKYWRSSEAVCHHRKFGDKLLMGLIWISWESCLLIYHLLQFQKIFTLRLPNDPAQVPQLADPGGVQLFSLDTSLR